MIIRRPIITLREASDLRDTVLARPPRLLHITMFFSLGVLLVGISWMWFSSVEVTVTTFGKLRPAGLSSSTGAAGERIIAPWSGRVAAVLVAEGAEVKAGDIVLRLDTEKVENDLQSARRMCESAKSGLESLVRLRDVSREQYEAERKSLNVQLTQAHQNVVIARQRREADITSANQELEKAQAKLTRIQGLRKTGDVTDQDVEDAQLRVKEAEARLANAQVDIDVSGPDVLEAKISEQEKRRSREIEELEIRITSAQSERATMDARRANLELDITRAGLIAPCDGQVTSIDIRPNDMADAGKALATVAPRKGFILEAAASRTDIGRIRVGMPCRVTLDAFDYRRHGAMNGRVEFIAPDAASRPSEAPVYLVRIAIDAAGTITKERGLLRFGMTGAADIVTGEESLFNRVFGLSPE